MGIVHTGEGWGCRGSRVRVRVGVGVGVIHRGEGKGGGGGQYVRGWLGGRREGRLHA